MQQLPNQRPSQPQWQPLSPQQQYSQYPPQPEQYQQPPQPQYQPPTPKARPPKKSFLWVWIVAALVIGIAIGYAAHVPGAQSTSPTTSVATVQATSQPTQAPTHAAITPTPTHALKWTTFQTFSGNGDKKTAIFSVPGDWKIVWSCQGFTDGSGIDGALNVTIYDTQNNVIDTLGETCKASSTLTNGESEEHQGGQVYLDIGGVGGPWTIQVQELK